MNFKTYFINFFFGKMPSLDTCFLAFYRATCCRRLVMFCRSLRLYLVIFKSIEEMLSFLKCLIDCICIDDIDGDVRRRYRILSVVLHLCLFHARSWCCVCAIRS